MVDPVYLPGTASASDCRRDSATSKKVIANHKTLIQDLISNNGPRHPSVTRHSARSTNLRGDVKIIGSFGWYTPQSRSLPLQLW